MPIQSSYKTGTATVTAGSAVVTGNGTAWALGLVNGGLFTRQGLAVPITSVESDTSLTLDYAWPGATGAGAYSIDLGRADAASAIVANRRLAEIIVGLSAFSPYGAELMSADDEAEARLLLELVKQESAADATAGRLLTVGAFGLGGFALPRSTQDLNTILRNGIFAIDTGAANRPINAQGILIADMWDNVSGGQHTFIVLGSGATFQRHRSNSIWGAWKTIWDSSNLRFASSAEAIAGVLSNVAVAPITLAAHVANALVAHVPKAAGYIQPGWPHLSATFGVVSPGALGTLVPQQSRGISISNGAAVIPLSGRYRIRQQWVGNAGLIYLAYSINGADVGVQGFSSGQVGTTSTEEVRQLNAGDVVRPYSRPASTAATIGVEFNTFILEFLG